jgi:environmental stress-induced protein Ves
MSGLAMLRLFTPADYCTMPWKNGGGRTTEIAAHPPGATLDTFVWRVSLADVACDGPFSRFPGVDRTIMLLEGAGMRLAGDGRDVELRMPLEPFRFSGDETIECTLLAGPVRDFNAMFRRGAARGSVAVVRGGHTAIAPTDFRLAYAATGAQQCVIAGRRPFVLEPGHAVLVERWADVDSAPLAIAPLAAGGIALVVSVECR